MIAKSLVRLLLLFILLASGIARADSAPPDKMVKDVTDQVLTVLRRDPGIKSGNRQHAISLIETKVAPHFDFTRMTSLAVGHAWQSANASQRNALIAQFRMLLVRTYANALAAYRDQTVTFPPAVRSTTGDAATVHCQIEKAAGEPITLAYSLAKTQGDWKVYDVAIAGVSLVTNYRGSFASEVEKSGVDGLVKHLEEKNRDLASTSHSAV